MKQPRLTPSKRSAPTNGIQKTMLIEYMAQNPKLRAGTFGPDFTYKNAQTLWETIKVKLNAVPGGARKDDWRMWRKTWADMKKTVTSKAVLYKKESQKTGGGTPPNSDLNDDDLMILDMISPKKIEGIPDIPESAIVFQFEEDATEVNPLEVVQDEAQPSVIEKVNDQKSQTLKGPDNEVVPIPDDHKVYTISAPGGKTKRQRLQTSLALSKQMVNQVEFQNNFTNDYYIKKMAYLEHKIKYEEKMLELSKETLAVAKENLMNMKENLKVNSSILNILANKK